MGFRTSATGDEKPSMYANTTLLSGWSSAVTGVAKEAAFRVGSTNTRFYLNDSNASSSDVSSPITTWNIGYMRIGRSNSAYYQGYLSQVIVWFVDAGTTDMTTVYDDDVTYFGIN
jgi:hypothetical protein